MSDELTQEEADNLLAQHKKYIRHEPVFWPNPGAKVTVDLLSLDEREAFLLDVSRASIKLERLVLQLRARLVTVVLVRLDLNGAGHRNPDDAELPCPHIHLYREGYHDKWAFHVPSDIFQTCAIGSKPRGLHAVLPDCAAPRVHRGAVLMTDVNEIARLVEQYQLWLKDKTTLKSVHADWVEISTPFLDRRNDFIQLYAASGDAGGYQITDDGNTIRDLELSAQFRYAETQGVTPDHSEWLPSRSKARRAQRTRERRQFCSEKTCADPGHTGGQRHVLLATPTVLSLFKEDVQKWLEHSDIRFVPNIQFIGKTGYIHHFDFAIPGSRAAPERIIKAIGNPNKDAALAYVTSWIDTSDQRPPSSQALAFLNDSGRTVGAPVLDALRQYDISPVLWSQRETHRQALAM